MASCWVMCLYSWHRAIGLHASCALLIGTSDRYGPRQERTRMSHDVTSDVQVKEGQFMTCVCRP
jgi:hypothetical protein